MRPVILFLPLLVVYIQRLSLITNECLLHRFFLFLTFFNVFVSFVLILVLIQKNLSLRFIKICTKSWLRCLPLLQHHINYQPLAWLDHQGRFTSIYIFGGFSTNTCQSPFCCSFFHMYQQKKDKVYLCSLLLLNLFSIYALTNRV